MRGESLDSLLRASAERYPHRPALTLWGQDIPYRDLDQAVDRLAGHLARLGPDSSPPIHRGSPPIHHGGQRIAIVAPNVPALVVALFAAWRTGAVAVPLNARLREYELGRILRDAEATAVISVGAYRGYSFSSVLPRLLPALPSGGAKSLFVDPMGEVEEEVPGTASAAPVVGALPDPLQPDIAALLYTSGTTGDPKGALATHQRELAGAAQLSLMLGMTPADVSVFVVPISHAFGLTCLLSTIASGGQAVLVESTFSLEPMLDAIEQHQATILHGSPALFASFLKAMGPSPDAGRMQFAPTAAGTTKPIGRTLRTGFVAGSACPPHLIEQLDDRGIRILNLFGMTEIGAAACCRPDDPPEVRYTTCGRPLPGYEIRIRAPIRGARTEGSPVGSRFIADPDSSEMGEVQVRGPCVTPGYYHQPGRPAPAMNRGTTSPANDQTFDGDWFRTGDLGELSEDGHVRISGRAKEVVQVAGLNVFPAEVEGFLLTHPDVEQAAVVGVPHEALGEAVEAFVVLRPNSGLTPQALLQFARERIAGYKLPYVIHILPELPRLASGKPDRAALRSSPIHRGGQSTKEEPRADTGAGTHSAL